LALPNQWIDQETKMKSAAANPSDDARHSAPILVGVDGSEPSRSAIKEAEEQGNSVLAVSTYAVPAIAMAAPGFSFEPANSQELADYTRDTLTRTVSEATAGHPSVRVEARVTEGPAAEALIDASHRASLLVVSSRGHGGFMGLLLGSVSQQCVTHAHCPVMVMRPYE
jgi:nucleotide-binding universal stress UspA family protein